MTNTRKVVWRCLQRGEPLQCGDMWAGDDPNTPERQGEDSYNLQMQAVHPDWYNKPAYHSQYSEGTVWRPLHVVDTSGPAEQQVNQLRKLTVQ